MDFKKSVGLLILLALVSCAKERKFEEILKEQVYTKDQFSIDPNDPYLYSPTLEDTPHNIQASRPFWVGDQKLVTFKFTENNLEILQIPNEERFKENSANFHPVMKIKIDHKEFKCKEDEFGDCTNKEEENEKISWQHKNAFKADFSSINVLETNTLPIELENLFSSRKCYTEVGSELKNVEITSEVINIKVSKTYSSDFICLLANDEIESLDDLKKMSFKINYNFSFVKLSKVASKDFKPREYPFEDENTFGFFTTNLKKFTAGNQNSLGSDTQLMNHWNPSRKEIVYYLNKSFYDKPKLIEVTQKAVENINRSLSLAGASFKIRLEDGRNKDLGDARNSFVILVEDPQASGVIGYGPSIVNPQTGEIISARVVMYYGTILKTIERAYTEMVEDYQRSLLDKPQEQQIVKELLSDFGSLTNGSGEELGQQLKNLKDNFQSHSYVKMLDIKKPTVTSRQLSAKTLSQVSFDKHNMYHNHGVEEKIEQMSRNNLYHESMMNFSMAVENHITPEILGVNELKPWHELSEAQKNKVIDIVLPIVWVPTLVHEFGHTLGLRHNFNGSEDKDNYYTKEELETMGIKRKVTYSSIMDYSYSNLNELPQMGKYDVAALKFGYSRLVELKDGSTKYVATTLDEMKKANIEIKDYKFCSDGHVSVNPTCNRFDEGSSLSEIAKHYKESYEKDYKTRARRNGRLRFSSVDDHAAASRVAGVFNNLRLFFELYDRIVKEFSLDPSNPQWESNEFLKDLKLASDISLDFFLDVLKTPDLHCVIYDVQQKRVAFVVPVSQVAREATSCYDSSIQLNPRYLITGEFGKAINHLRDPNLRGDLKADPSSIDVRGTYMDKILAAEFLTKREMPISTFNTSLGNYLDYPGYQEKVMNVMNDLMLGKRVAQTKVRLPNGKETESIEEFPVTDSLTLVQVPFSQRAARFFGFKNSQENLSGLLLAKFKPNIHSSVVQINSQYLTLNFDVTQIPISVPDHQLEFHKLITFNDKNGNPMAKFGLVTQNKIALDILILKQARELLDSFDRAKLVEVANARINNEIPSEIPEDLRIFYDMEFSHLYDYLVGSMLTEEQMISILASLSK